MSAAAIQAPQSPATVERLGPDYDDGDMAPFPSGAAPSPAPACGGASDEG